MKFKDLPKSGRFCLPCYPMDTGSFQRIGETLEYARCDPFGQFVAFPFAASEDMEVIPNILTETFYA